MRFRDFKLERYFGEWEFSARILLGSSDPESMRLPELLALADEDGRRVPFGRNTRFQRPGGGDIPRRHGGAGTRRPR